MRRLFRAGLVLIVVGLSLDARAEELDGTLEKSAPHQFVLSVSPLRAVVSPMGEVGAELNFDDKMAAALTLGFGPRNVDRRTMSGDFESERALCISTGAQFRYYAWGDFDRGLFGGAELVYIYIDRDRESSVRPKHEALWGGPTVGYKHTFDFGLVLSAAFSVGIPLHKPDGLSEDEVPGGVEDGKEPVVGGVLLWPNLSVGWAI